MSGKRGGGPKGKYTDKNASHKGRAKRRRPAPCAKQNRPDGTIRLNKAIAQTGIASRRDADQLIAAGRVAVDGQIAAIGSFVSPSAQIEVDGQVLRPRGKPVYLALNKPVGIECTTDRRVADNIIDFIAYPKRIFPIGRLDKDSEGLILLTDDGDIVNPILLADNAHEKEYIVAVNKPITPQFLRQMAAGVSILGTVTLPCQVVKLSKNRFKIILVQGLNRQIRRMCQALGYQVTALRRVRIMNIELARLKVGTYRQLSAAELAELKRLVGRSEQ